VQPPLADAIELAHRNHECLAVAGANIQGRNLAMIRRWARGEVYRAAREYTAKLTAGKNAPGKNVPGQKKQREQHVERSAAELDATAFFVSGHQPALFHPGVWVKNFAVARLASDDRAVGLNLVVDTDTFSGTSIRIPTGPVDRPHVIAIEFDEPRPRQPWEEARVVNRELFATFARRVEALLGGGFTPLLPDFWPAAVEHAGVSDSLAECLTVARIQWERARGAGNLELPISRMCALEPFLWFASHILAHLPRFQAVYNQVLDEYRQTNHVRSRTHPVPDLREIDGWLEAPFRVWRAGDEVRKRLFAKQIGKEVHLSDGERVFAALPLTPDKDACCAVRELQKLEGQGIRLRTRALTTTLFTRLCFADLFVHGIGGAKYDQMTDRIVARFFGLAAPEFLTMSATLLLPTPGLDVHSEDESRLRRQLRDLDYNSDRHLPRELSAAQAALVADKQRLVAEQTEARHSLRRVRGASHTRGSGAGYARFRRLQEINRQLTSFTREERRRIEEELSRTRQYLAANAVWHDREYASCLYPAEKLQRFMDHVCSAALP
ncbi:MAG TPA: hypothetical protein VGH74_08245, partial [Planctomycetaceae bacterium]